MAVKLNSTGGGSVTLDSPSTASNYTITLPSAAGTLATTTGTGSVFTNPTINGFTGDTSAITIGTTQFVKDTSGNIGIGTASPSTYGILATYGSVNNNSTALGSADAANVSVLNNNISNLSNRSSLTFNLGGLGKSVVAGYYHAFNGSGDIGTGLQFGTQTNLAGGTTEKMRIDATGNVGIMTTTPATTLHTYSANAGTPATTGTATTGVSVRFQNLSVNFDLGTYSGGACFIQPRLVGNNASNLDLVLNPNGGNLLVGTTSVSPSNSNSLYIQPSAGFIGYQHATGTASGTGYSGYYYNGTAIGSVTQSGTTAVLYNVASDQRLKENIVDAPNALSSINAIKVRSFDWKADGSHSEYGYIAQELLEVAPEAVHVPVDPEEMMGVDFGKLTPRLVKAIQELSQEIETLKQKVNA